MTPRILAFVLSALLPVSVWAADGTTTAADELIHPAGDTELSAFLWINRLIIIFADTPGRPQVPGTARQAHRRSRASDRARRRGSDRYRPGGPQPGAAEAAPARVPVRADRQGWRRQAAQAVPYSVREVTRTIDKTPMRQREVEERRESQ